MNFDFLNLSDSHRYLISRVSPPRAKRVLLEPLDKGLSGAGVWLARWDLPRGLWTDFSVLKINNTKKIAREMRAFNEIVCQLDNRVGHFVCKRSREHNLAIIRQPFRGRADGTILSFRNKMLSLSSSDSPENLIDSLYLDRMQNWHPTKAERYVRSTSFEIALDWWTRRYALREDISKIGQSAAEADIYRCFNMKFLDLERFIEALFRTKHIFPIGPVHGDLHAQNILVDSGSNIHLIDFGWTSKKWKAIDFLMLECSIKFLVIPQSARQKDLLILEQLVELDVGHLRLQELSELLYGCLLYKTARAIRRLRELCLNFGYVTDMNHYRQGLVVLTSCLSGYPRLNRRFLLNSLCLHISKLQLQ